MSTYFLQHFFQEIPVLVDDIIAGQVEGNFQSIQLCQFQCIFKKGMVLDDISFDVEDIVL